jgi:hypothetical protein
MKKNKMGRRDKDEPKMTDFEKFRDNQRHYEVFGAMNEVQQDRYETQRGTNFNDK